MIESVVRSLQRCPIGEVLVVAGHQASAVAEALGSRLSALGESTPIPTKSQEPRAKSCRIVLNERYREGMLTSVQCGVAAASPETTWFLVALVDQPAIDPAIVTRLITTARGSWLVARGESGSVPTTSHEPRVTSCRIVIPAFEGRRGHPLLFRADLAPEVLTLPGEIGLRELMQRHPDEILHVPVASDTVLRDMDTPEEYQREVERLRRESSDT